MSLGGFTFGAPKTTAPTTAAGGFSFGTPAGQGTATLGATPASTASTTPGFSFGQTPSTAPTTGLNFGTPAATSATVGFNLGGTTTTPATGGLFGTSATSSAASSTGIGLTKPLTATATSAPTLGLGGLGQTSLPTSTTATTGLGLKLGGTTAGFTGLTAASTAGSIFNQTSVKPVTSGLGGVDPKTTTSSANTTADGSKSSEGKTIKEQMVESNIMTDIEAFKKFLKEEKTEEEHIKRLSSTPMVKVQEDNFALRQLLSVVASGLQRNACAVDKLKKEMTQELKYAEMATRTKEIPVGLQYENTAPTHYFQGLVESFENQMLTYRQQIEVLESHLASLHQPSRLTSDELVLLLRKLHEAFVAMAAQLQQVHEAVKTQKEHYLNYRKVFLGDSRNIFERQKKAPVKVPSIQRTDYGQSPFPGVHDAAAVAMASALNRSQQPQAQTGAPPPNTGFARPMGFGSTAGNNSFQGFGTPLGSTSGTGFKGFGGAGTSAGTLFGNTSNLATTQSTGVFNSTFPATAQPALNLSTATEQPFQLNKPPVGTKRGKR